MSSLAVRRLFISLAVLLFVPVHATEAAGASTPQPKIAPASNEGELAIKQFKVPKDFKVELIAAEPHLANPVAFWIDEQGDIYIAETFRHTDGVLDIRGHMNWLDEDLASKSVEDRVQMLKKHLGENVSKLTVNSDRLKKIFVGNDGKAERSTVFADGFNNIPDGIGAGVLARNGNVYYANIPDLWLLRDTNGDGVADVRKSLHHGYGVRVGFLGHDLHGLRLGPDGKLYFSIGDRGASIKTKGGKIVANPETGAVYRCNQDGSELEIFAYGLRNPQELVFDQYGNLWTGDNNSDGGDKARWVYLVEGGDSGWRIGYQFLNTPVSRGPWNAEKMWHPYWPGQAADIVPPIENIASGPSGITYYPGTGLPDRYQEHFFLTDFHGGKGSGIHSFGVRPFGAYFKLIDREDFIWEVLPTDVDFGLDGGIYWSDWVEGWNKTGKGRIYHAYNPDLVQSPLVLQTKKLLSEGTEKSPLADLAGLLTHPDMRVRQEAQFALADKGAKAIKTLAHVAAKSDHRLARLHAIWGLGQISVDPKASNLKSKAIEPIIALLNDRDAEVRAQTAKVLGNARAAGACDGLIRLLADSQARPRFFAAIALGKLGRKEAAKPLVELLRANDDKDPYLRHAAMMGLLGSNNSAALREAAQDNSAAVRMGVLLVMRRREMPEVALFLQDGNTNVVREAARAINDLPIQAALSQLAALIATPIMDEPTLRRVINANLRIGKPDNATGLAAFAGNGDTPASLRIEAIEALGDWAKPSGRDRITGLWRPLAKREGQVPRMALQKIAPSLLHHSSEALGIACIHAITKLGMTEVRADIRRLATDTNASPQVRLEALRSLAILKDPLMFDAVQLALHDANEALRKEGTKLQAQLKPADAVEQLKIILERGSTGEKQTALQVSASLSNAVADEILSRWMDKMLAREVPLELQLDVLEAAEKRGVPTLKEKIQQYDAARPPSDRLRHFREAVAGGDAAQGKKIFFERPEASCVRCHKINGEGGDVGPDLTHIGTQKDREYLLESLIFPNTQIAAGFETVILTLKDGRTCAGLIKSETQTTVEINSPEDGLLKLNKADIQSRHKGLSAMPEELRQALSKSDIRDIVEFLSQLK